MEFRVLHSEVIFQGRVFNVRIDQIGYPDGRQSRTDIVEHRSSVTIIAIDDQDLIWFVKQIRVPVGEWLLELPAGVMETSESPADTAQREIREEIGMAAQSLQQIGEFYLAPGYCTEKMYIFLARDLYPAPLDKDPDEYMSVEKIPVETAIEYAKNGEIKDAKTLAALLLVQRYLKKGSAA